jgi:hypothetical protein
MEPGSLYSDIACTQIDLYRITRALYAISRLEWDEDGDYDSGGPARVFNLPGCQSTNPTRDFIKLIFYSCAPVFDVSPLLMGQESYRCDNHSATSYRILPLKFRPSAV